VPKLVSKSKCISRGGLDAFSVQHEAEIRPSVLECQKDLLEEYVPDTLLRFEGANAGSEGCGELELPGITPR
jgi:hypothetical protein